MDEEEIKKRKLEELVARMQNNKINVTDATFQKDVIERSKNVPVIVDFWAVWCGPCRMISPVLEKIADKYKGKIVLAKLNVDENPITSRSYGIMSIPSVKMFKNGQVADEFIGALPESAVESWVRRNLNE